MNTFDEKDQLTRELQDRSQDVDGHPIDLASVKQSAHRIQLRRRIASGAVAAAVLAVAVPTALSVTNATDRSADPVGPDPTPAGPVRLTTNGLPRGVDPQISYLHGRQLVQGGSSIELPVAYHGIAAYGDGWAGLSFTETGSEIAFLDGEGNVRESIPGGGSIAVNADGDRLAYVRAGANGDASTLVSAPSDGSDPTTWPMPVGREISTVGFLGSDSVVYETDGENPVVGVASADGRTAVLPGLIGAGGTSPASGLVAAQTSSSDTGSCWAVVAVDGGTLWETCAHSLQRFSPDGRYLIASDAYGDGAGARSLAILDAETGDVMAEYQPGRRSPIAITQMVWEDEDTVLALANEDNNWTVLRADVQGQLEAASDPTPGDVVDSPITFVIRP